MLGTPEGRSAPPLLTILQNDHPQDRAAPSPPPVGVQEPWGGPAFPGDDPQDRAAPSPPPVGVQEPWGGPAFPGERQTRIAARRGFVEIKQQFIDAVAGLGGPRGDWLRHQVRQSRGPSDLWQLRATVRVAMGSQSPLARADLQRALEAVFPGEGERTGALPAPLLPTAPLLL